MSDLLTDAERLEIRAAMRDVGDTFFKTPVAYHLLGGDSLDRFQEERKGQDDTTYNLMGLVTFPKDSADWGKGLPSGMLDMAHVKVTLNYEDLEDLLLTDDVEKTVKFREGRDYFITQERQYKVLFVHYAGPLDRQNILIQLFGQNRT